MSMVRLTACMELSNACAIAEEHVESLARAWGLELALGDAAA